MQPSSRAELEARREGALARGPSGFVYKLREINLQRHALAGGLPPTLAQVALEGEEAMDRLFRELANPELSDEERSANTEMLGYMDGLVEASIVEPSISRDDLGDPTKPDEPGILPAGDYQWIVSLAMRTNDFDADGRRVFGVETFDRFQILDQLDDCHPDCPECGPLRDALSENLGGSVGAVAGA